MSEARSYGSYADRTNVKCEKSMALHEMGDGYRRTFPYSSSIEEISAGDDRLLHEIDYGRIVRKCERQRCEKLRLEKHHLLV